MKLLLVNYEYPPLGGGAGNATHYMARAFLELGHQPIVLSTAFGELRGTRDEDGVLVHRVAARRRRLDRSNPIEMASFVHRALWAAPRLVRRQPIDAAVAFFTTLGGPVGLQLRVLRRIPYVVSLRGGDVPGLVPELNGWHRILRPLRRAILRRAAGVVANDEGLAHLSEGADPVPVQVVPNGVDCGFFAPPTASPTPARAEPFRWLFCGRMQPQKNLEALLRQFARVAPQTPMELHLAGDGPLRGHLASLARSLGIAPRATWHGWLDKPRLRDLYRACDGFVNPSLYEGMPNTVLEAMACGLPVVATSIPGNRALVRSGITGRLVELGRPDELGDALLELARQRLQSRAFGRQGRADAEEKFSWIETARRYLDILHLDLVPTPAPAP